MPTGQPEWCAWDESSKQLPLNTLTPPSLGSSTQKARKAGIAKLWVRLCSAKRFCGGGSEQLWMGAGSAQQSRRGWVREAVIAARQRAASLRGQGPGTCECGLAVSFTRVRFVTLTRLLLLTFCLQGGRAVPPAPPACPVSGLCCPGHQLCGKGRHGGWWGRRGVWPERGADHAAAAHSGRLR